MRRTLPLLLLLLAALASPLRAQGSEVTSTLFSRVEDRTVKVAIEVRVEPGWYVYHIDLGESGGIGLPTLVELSGEGVSFSEVRYPEPIPYDLPEGGFVNIHKSRFRLYALGSLAEGASGEGIEADIEGLVCLTDGSCVRFGEHLVSRGEGRDKVFEDFPDDLSAPETSAAAGEGPELGPPVEAAPPGGASGGTYDWAAYEPIDRGIGAASSGEDEEDGSGTGLLTLILLAFVAGMILNIMPCVLPVVSIKVLSFVNQAGESKGRVFALGLAFSAGILSVFLVLAGFAAFASYSWGDQFQQPWFLVVMIGVVFAFALSLFGVFELGVPSKVGQVAGARKREGLVGAFSLGILSTLLATPCSGPFLGSTLAWAVSQERHVIIAVFGVAGLGMAAPYAVLTSNPALLKYVPRPGPWMDTFKQAMAFVLLFTVIFLMVSVSSDLLLYTVTFLVFVGLGCWIWGRYASLEQSAARRWGTLAWAGGTTAVGALLCFSWLPAFFEEAEIWEPFDREHFAQYQEEGRPVFIDFTADWCLTCQTNELVVYESEEALELFRRKNVAVMKADETEKGKYTSMLKSLQNALGSYSIPFCAVFPGNDPLRPLTFKDLVRKKDFLEVLEALPDAR